MRVSVHAWESAKLGAQPKNEEKVRWTEHREDEGSDRQWDSGNLQWMEDKCALVRLVPQSHHSMKRIFHTARDPPTSPTRCLRVLPTM